MQAWHWRSEFCMGAYAERARARALIICLATSAGDPSVVSAPVEELAVGMAVNARAGATEHFGSVRSCTRLQVVVVMVVTVAVVAVVAVAVVGVEVVVVVVVWVLVVVVVGAVPVILWCWRCGW